MAAAIVIGFIVISFGLWLWLVIRIGKTSVIGAILTFFLGLPALYYLFRNWGDEELDIRVPFFVNLIPLVLAIVAAVALPGYQDYVITAKAAEQQQQAAVDKSNPEMERWCRQQNNAVYSPDHGTCVEGDPNQQQDEAAASDDVFDQLQEHFSASGIGSEVLEVDPNAPGAGKFAQQPEIRRAFHFVFDSSSGVMPTMALIGECNTVQDCRALAQKMDRPDAPFAVASNENLLFFGMLSIGDAVKMKQARKAFIAFQAP